MTLGLQVNSNFIFRCRSACLRESMGQVNDSASILLSAKKMIDVLIIWRKKIVWKWGLLNQSKTSAISCAPWIATLKKKHVRNCSTQVVYLLINLDLHLTFVLGKKYVISVKFVFEHSTNTLPAPKHAYIKNWNKTIFTCKFNCNGEMIMIVITIN